MNRIHWVDVVCEKQVFVSLLHAQHPLSLILTHPEVPIIMFQRS